MKKTTNHLAMATPCPNLNVKRPMSRDLQPFKPSPKTYLKLILFFWSLAISGALAQGQNTPPNQTQAKQQGPQSPYTLKGKITDTQNNPLIGAIITDAQSQKTAQIDQNGNFKLNTSTQTGKVIITYLGYQAQTLSYTTEKELIVQLTEDRSQLQAVEINTGYYSVKQKNLTGSISSVKAGQIEKQPISNPLLALAGRVTGAQITQSSGIPGAPVSLLIRGIGSLDAGTQPLYLVDGVPFGSASLTSTNTTTNYGSLGASPFATLAPEDIENISILKDADATAIYGSRGANGVVLITTKKASNGKIKIEMNTYFGTSQLANTLELLSTSQYLELRKKAFALDNTTIKTTDYDLNGAWDPARQTNWQKELLGKSAKLSSQRISLSGGSPTSSFLLAANRQKQGSINSSGDSYTKYGVQFLASQQTTDQKLKATLTANYSAEDNDWTNTDLLNPALSLAPNAPPLYTESGALNWASSSWINPLRAFANPYKANSSTLITSLNTTYSPIKNLRATLAAGYTTTRLDDRNMVPTTYFDPAQKVTPASAGLFTNASSSSSLIAEPQLNYSPEVTRYGKFDVLLGYSIQQLKRDQLTTLGAGFASDALIENIMAATTVQIRANTSTTYRYSGFYGRVGYALHERYLLNLTARRDGSSRFGTARRQANFGAIGAAYLASETRLIKENLPFISLLKLHASFGSSGSDQIGDYEYLNTYQSQTGYNGAPGLSPVRLFNPDFAWEKSKKAEIGLEMGMFGDRLQVSATYYRNRSSSQLVNYPLPRTTGFASIRSNLQAVVQNTGLELETSYRMKAGKFRFETSLNYTLPRTKLLEFPGLATSSYATRYALGESLTIGKVYELLGVDPATGIYAFRDYNADGVISALDRQKIVQRGQTGYGGWNNAINYQQFELSFLLQFTFQRLTTYRAGLPAAPGRLSNLPLADQGKYWMQPGDIAELQRPTSGANSAAVSAFSNYQLSDTATGDASFARLKNLSLSYRTTKLIPDKTLRLYFQGQNLWTFTKYFGIDPEQPGLTTPPLRTLTLGLQLIL